MNIAHHPSDDLLLSYASGSLDEGTALLVATHLALCPACRAEISRLESLGGAILEAAPPVALTADALEATLARLDRKIGTETKAAGTPFFDDGARRIPQPLRGYLGERLTSLPWRTLGPRVGYVDVVPKRNGISVRLLRIAAGTAIPDHGHGGDEHTLVLEGAFSDEIGRFARGDVETAGPADVHSPIAEADGECICLAVTHAPLRFEGWVNRAVGRLAGF